MQKYVCFFKNIPLSIKRAPETFSMHFQLNKLSTFLIPVEVRIPTFKNNMKTRINPDS